MRGQGEWGTQDWKTGVFEEQIKCADMVLACQLRCGFRRCVKKQGANLPRKTLKSGILTCFESKSGVAKIEFSSLAHSSLISVISRVVEAGGLHMPVALVVPSAGMEWANGVWSETRARAGARLRPVAALQMRWSVGSWPSGESAGGSPTAGRRTRGTLG